MAFFKRLALVLAALFFLAAGANHFAHSAFYVRILPPWLHAPVLLVQISGAYEMLGGAGLLVPATRRPRRPGPHCVARCRVSG